MAREAPRARSSRARPRRRGRHRQARRHERPERDQQDDQRHRQRGVLRPLEVLAQRLVQLVRCARITELGHGEARMSLLDARDRVEDGLHLRVCLVHVAPDLELDERRAPIVRDLPCIRRFERRSHPLNLRQARNRARDIRNRRPEGGIADAPRPRQDEHALAGAIREARVLQDLLGRPRSAGRGVRLRQHLRASDRPQHDRSEAEHKPGRDCCLPVSRAPPSGARSDVEVHLPLLEVFSHLASEFDFGHAAASSTGASTGDSTSSTTCGFDSRTSAQRAAATTVIPASA